MKLILATLVVTDGKTERHSFEEAILPVEEFDASRHWNIIFDWEEFAAPPAQAGHFSVGQIKNMVRIWHTVDLTIEEQAYLKKEGKLITHTDLPNKTEITYEGNQ